jgi:hypothetical protein
VVCEPARRRLDRLLAASALSLGLLVAGLLAGAAGARADAGMVSIMEDDPLVLSQPQATLQRMRDLGVGVVRLSLRWDQIAPDPGSTKAPEHFDASDPAAYSAASWARYDNVAKDAAQLGMRLDLDITGGVPRWAEAGKPPRTRGFQDVDWQPSAADFEAFVKAVGERYGGDYDPTIDRLSTEDPNDLPRVSIWSIWNEPNYGQTLSPQGRLGDLSVPNSPRIYRGLLAAGWTALQQTGHRSATILIGESGPRGERDFGEFGPMRPIAFVQSLYCLSSSYRPLRGRLAELEGCPTSASGTRAFRSRNPALFTASAFADHPYPYAGIGKPLKPTPPTVEPFNNPGYGSLADIGQLERALDRALRSYGSRRHYQIWDTEFGYITSPPKPAVDRTTRPPTYYVSQQTAAYYDNWAEYISYRNPRIASFDQYLLKDSVKPTRASDWGAFASGLIGYGGAAKGDYAAWRMPLYLPSTRTRPGHALLVWGEVRPADYAFADLGSGGAGYVEIQFAAGRHGRFATVASVRIANPHGYFTTHVRFIRSGRVRLAWTYPPSDPALGPEGEQIFSRTFSVRVRR